MQPSISELKQQRRAAATTLLRMYKKANASHIGSSLSCLEILLDLYASRCGADDVVVLSKGHAAAALYTVQSMTGRLDPKLLDTFYLEGTLLSAHPPCGRQLPSIPFGTGSLGHGLSLAAGVALSQRFTGKKFHTWCVLSDGDCGEGSTWEAALFAAHQKLDNLTVVVDRNHLQGFGRTEDVTELEPFAEKWRAFGFEVATAANGNDFQSLAAAHAQLIGHGKPKIVIAETTKGHGVSFMANKMEWHYLPMSDAQLEQALLDTDGHA